MIPSWLDDLQPATTGMLGQEGLRLWELAKKAAVGIRARSVVYPVFPEEPDPSWAPEARATLGQVADSWCLMGPNLWVTRAEPLMPPSVVQHRIEYQFLVRSLRDCQVPPGPGVVRRATPGDGNALYPLQEAYEREEVLFDQNDFQPLVCRLHLGKLLRTQEIVGLWENGKPVAKAGTNALTSTWAQVGGVYTKPEHRGRGHQKRLMAFLLQNLHSQGRSACLFVKKSNPIAIGLYRRLGFDPAGDFLITYGQRQR